MGIPSPFIGATGSPVLGRSRQASPDLPRLKSFDAFDNLEVLELCPPSLGFFTEPKAKVLPAWEGGLEAPEQQQPQLTRTRTVPVWPSHLPNYMNEVCEMNTFIDVPEAASDFAEPPRRRAGSDFTGMCKLEKQDLDVRLEDLRKPLPETLHRPEAPEQDLSCEQQWCWMVPDEVNGGWTMVYVNTCEAWQETPQTWPADGQEWPEANPSAPCLPPLPPAGEAYKPKWVYGSSWPFNCAPTTLILDNLPADLTQAELLAVLDASGFRGLYDFAFMPVSFRTRRSQGNAIVNLTRHSYGLALAARAQGFADWGPAADGSCCEVKWSLPLQGIVEHIENYRNHPAMHESVPEALRPTLFLDGWQVPFPAPTKRLYAPRTWHR
mmetsp:Transcript_107914/g.315518  ORF Transcript_107914/g.315518 Transcript_107914/m.315518 type:complete len:380 (-) Transcript_107914:164-1303(-)